MRYSGFAINPVGMDYSFVASPLYRGRYDVLAGRCFATEVHFFLFCRLALRAGAYNRLLL